MAIGAVDARIAIGATLHGFIATGFDNVTRNVQYLNPGSTPSERAGAPRAPTMFASINWRENFVEAIYSLAQMEAVSMSGSASVQQFMQRCMATELGCPMSD
eukprot:SAG31_NODE_22512_length_524_cov_0.731765_1_plen_101_part_10